MTRTAAWIIARASAVATTVVATAALAGATDGPSQSEQGFRLTTERLVILPTQNTLVALQSVYAPDRRGLAFEEGGIAWAIEPIGVEVEHSTQRIGAGQTSWKDGTTSLPQPSRLASFIATAALVAFFFLRRIA